MAYFRPRFRDASGALATYDWQIGWADEEPLENRRNIEHTARTDGVGYVRQQGEATPPTFKLKGHILHANQDLRFRQFYAACATRTIYYRDVDGVEYEAIITAYTRERKRTIKNPRDSTIPLHFWEYTIEIEVV